MTEASLPQESVFLQALETPSGADRVAFLDRACGANGDLRAEVEALLRANARSGDMLDLPEKATSTTDKLFGERPGTTIGPYKLLQQIGEGGFGTVFMAEQSYPVQRKVAIKLIKPGMDSSQVIGRFEAERQALALMDHPNIAKVFDAGTTPPSSPPSEGGAWGNGRPYFVMELVKGVPITRYCDEHHLTPKERLELFIPVCLAVQHAHHKGIIHRDMKPSNVMVCIYDGKPVPKVIDFGVAKATGSKLTERTLYTEFGAIVGTFEYMSPEQAELDQLDIDTRSDIYSLGVLLYELLTGTTPLDRKRMKEVAILELLRVIREEEAPRPSTRLTTAEGLPSIAANRGTEAKRLRGMIRGELDWIVMKCLEKDRNRRYDAANGLARDIGRYLHDEPVQACPPSLAYQFRKFARRHRVGLVLGGWGLLCLLLVGCGLLWVRHQEEAHANEQTGRNARIQRDVEAALQEAMAYREQARALSQDPGKAQAALAIALAAVKRGEDLLAGSQIGESLESQLGNLKEQLTEEDTDRRMMDRLEEIRLIEGEPNIVGGETSRETTHRLYAEAFRNYGIDVLTLDPSSSGRRVSQRAIRAQLVAILDNWGWFTSDNKLRDRFVLIADVADPNGGGLTYRMRHALAKDDTSTLRELARGAEVEKLTPTVLADLGTVLFLRGASSEAVALLRRAQVRYADNFWVNRQLGNALMSLKPPAVFEALHFYYASLAIRPRNARTWMDIGNILRGQDRFEEAIAALQQGIVCNTAYDDAHASLGNALRLKKDLDGAISSYNAALRVNPRFAETYAARGNVHADLGQWPEATADLAKATAMRPDDFAIGYAYAIAQLGAGHKEAYRRACAALLKRFKEANVPSLNSLLVYICVVAPESAVSPDQLVNLADSCASLFGGWNVRLSGAALYRAGKHHAALECFSKACKISPLRAWDWLFMAMAQHQLGRGSEARDCLAKAIGWIDAANKRGAPGTSKTGPDWFRLQERVEVQCLRGEAEALLKAEESTSKEK